MLYEYAVCDVPLLVQNLGGDAALGAKAMKAIALAMCRSIFEKAKRNGTAPHTPADFFEVVIRRDAPMSLANAFLKPVKPRGDDDVMDVSIQRLKEQEKKYDEALPKFQAAVALKPNDPVLLNNLGFIYFMMGRYDDALNYLQKTLAVDPRRKEAHENIADTYMKPGRKAEARQHYEQFLALWPTTSRGEEVRKLLQSLN